MTEKSCYSESFKADASTIIDKIKAIIREGNVRRVIIEHDGRTIAEFPLTVGVVGAVIAPAAAAIAAVVALFKDCTIHVERASGDEHAQAAASARAV